MKPKRMPVVYVAGPVRAVGVEKQLEKEQNLFRAWLWAGRVWEAVPYKAFVFSAPLNTARLDGFGNLPDSVWLECDLEQLRRSDALVMQPRWRDSEGCKLEHTRASQWGKPIFYLEDDNGLERLAAWATEQYERMNAAEELGVDPEFVGDDREEVYCGRCGEVIYDGRCGACDDNETVDNETDAQCMNFVWKDMILEQSGKLHNIVVGD